MNKLVTMMLGLSLCLGIAGMAFGDDSQQKKEITKKKKDTKKGTTAKK